MDVVPGDLLGINEEKGKEGQVQMAKISDGEDRNREGKLLVCKMFNGNSATLKREFKLLLYELVFESALLDVLIIGGFCGNCFNLI